MGLPNRAEILASLRASADSPDNDFDLLVVEGGATGAGVALDATSRGFKVALVERNDLSSARSRAALGKSRIRARFLQTVHYHSHMLPSCCQSTTAYFLSATDAI
ncbi:hypothetical protein H2248_007087 [Termitomyces sp. 'cryptogamus']|nr:hypothetical protein H2248_007087 [Termitomyces sp. 'cryptogamus']